MSKEEILFGTKEWAPYNFNFISGCSNDCTYCYAKEMAIRFKRKTSDTWKDEDPVPMKGKSFRKRDGRIMIPSSHDITPSNIDLALEVMGKLLVNGNELLIVTKPHFSCMKQIIDQFEDYKSAIQLRFTIGSVSNDVLKLWEPGATGFDDRIKSLRYAYEHGYSTTISAEPLLDETPDALYDALHPFVTGSIWIGKMNFPDRRGRMNAASSETPAHVKVLMKAQSDENIISIWERYRDNPMIEWKESIKKVITAHNL